MSTLLSQEDSRFTVGRWSATYDVSRDLPDLSGLQTRLDGIVNNYLAEFSKSFLEQSLASSDPSVWRIRNLSFEFSLDGRFSDEHGIAREWSRSLSSEILSIIESGEVSDSVLRFASRVEYLAQFVCDLASSRAWGNWYYEEFLDLQGLSVRKAICTIFLNESAPAELLLQIASITRLETVLTAISEDDAQMIFDLCFDTAAPTSSHEKLHKWAGIVLELWNSAPLRAGSRSENHFKDALRLLARTLSQHPAGKDHVALKAVINGLLELRQVFWAIDRPSLLDGLLERLAASDVDSAASIAARSGVFHSTEPLSFFAELMQGDLAWAQQAVAVVLGDSNRKKFLTAQNIAAGDSFLSSFGGIFLLAPSLIASDIEELAHSAAKSSDTPEKTAAVLRHLVGAKCFGRERFADSCDDPALRLFSGFDKVSFRQALKDLDIEQLDLNAADGAWLPAPIDPRDEIHLPYFSLAGFWPDFKFDSKLDYLLTLVSSAAVRHFSRRLFGFRASSPDYIYENFLSGTSEIRRVADRLEIRLPLSPLSMILRMAGMQDQRFNLPWQKGMEIWLLPPHE